MRKLVAALGLATLLAGAAAAAAPAGVELWHGAAAGMNIDQVVAAVPQSVPFTGQSMENGGVAALAAPAELGGAQADAIFFFHARTLSAVLVESRRIDGGRPAYLAKTAALEAAMTGAYGPPFRCLKRPEIAATACEWRAPGLKIALSYRDVGGGAPLLQVLYAPAP